MQYAEIFEILVTQRAKAPFPPPSATAARGLERSHAAQMRLLGLGRESPKRSRTSLRRTVAASSQSSYASLRADWCPPRRPFLTAFPPFTFGPSSPAAKKCASCFSSNRGVLTNFHDKNARLPLAAAEAQHKTAIILRFRGPVVPQPPSGRIAIYVLS